MVGFKLFTAGKRGGKANSPLCEIGRLHLE